MDNSHRLQEIEIYLHSLVKSLQEGKLPVNIQNISQVFDTAIASTPRLSLPPTKFSDVYNDIPNILEAYAIAVNLSPDSYRQTNQQQIIFDRHPHGNYWIIPIAATPSHAWLVPNPTRQIDLTRLNTLSFAFDWPDRDRTTEQDTFKLLEPALVNTLPTAAPSWKLIKRGTISTFLNATARAHYQAIELVSPLTVFYVDKRDQQEMLGTVAQEMGNLSPAQVLAGIQSLKSNYLAIYQCDAAALDRMESNAVEFMTRLPSEQQDRAVVEAKNLQLNARPIEPSPVAIPAVATQTFAPLPQAQPLSVLPVPEPAPVIPAYTSQTYLPQQTPLSAQSSKSAIIIGGGMVRGPSSDGTPYSSLGWLRQYGFQYKYGVQNTESVTRFESSADQSIIEIQILEDARLYNKYGVVQPKRSGLERKIVRFMLKKDGESFKISDYDVIGESKRKS